MQEILYQNDERKNTERDDIENCNMCNVYALNTN